MDYFFLFFLDDFVLKYFFLSFITLVFFFSETLVLTVFKLFLAWPFFLRPFACPFVLPFDLVSGLAVATSPSLPTSVVAGSAFSSTFLALTFKIYLKVLINEYI